MLVFIAFRDAGWKALLLEMCFTDLAWWKAMMYLQDVDLSVVWVRESREMIFEYNSQDTWIHMQLKQLLESSVPGDHLLLI